jgi:Rrf2 family protein
LRVGFRLVRRPLVQQEPTVRSIPQTSGALHFSTRGEYGVRLMVELTRHYGAGPVSLAEMADHESLPRPYLEQLVSSLRGSGLVRSTRGARGGYELARDPSEIRMSEIIVALEGPITPMLCAAEHPGDVFCDRTSFCQVQHLWLRVRDAVVQALDSLTLGELAGPVPAHPARQLPIRPSTLLAGGPARTEPVPNA